MIAPLNCDECKMQYRCTHISTDCKYPEGRQYGVTTYDKMIADKGSALEKRLEEAESLLLEVGFDWTSDIGRKVREYFERRGVSQWDKVFGSLPDLPDCEE